MNEFLHSNQSLSHEINNYLTIIYSQLQHIEHMYQYLSKDASWIRMKEDFDCTFLMLKDSMKEDASYETPPTTNLCDFLKHLYQSWLPRFEEKQIDFSIPKQIENVNLNIRAQALQQIFHNILSNSYDAICGKDNVDKNSNFVRIDTQLQHKSILISIQDSGCGIPKQQLENIFTPGVSYKEQGHGIGLSLVLELVKQADGNLHISSSPGRGTLIKLQFPL